jgi:lipoprotein-releasing system permease protein
VRGGANFFIALRYLSGRAQEGGRYLRGADTGIALSLIPILVTLIVADGMIRGITDRYLELGTGHLQIHDFLDPRGVEDIAETVAGFEGVRGVWNESQGLGIILGNHGKIGTTIRAVDPSFWTDPGSAAFLKIIAGSAELESDREVLLGEALASSIGAEVGKTIRIMTVRVGTDGRNIPAVSLFTVRGIVSSGYRELDSLWCVMSYEAGKNILPPELSYSYMMVKIDDPYKGADAMARAIPELLGPGYRVFTWKTIQQAQYRSYESTRQLLLFIMALVVIVAAVNVSSATSMLVIERQRDIAVLKTAGASPRGTTGIFLWGSFLTGLIGGIAGIALGLLIGYFINPLIRGLETLLGLLSAPFGGKGVTILDPEYYLETIPIVIDWKSVLFIGFFTVLCSILASWLPARRAGKLKPIEILRKY